MHDDPDHTGDEAIAEAILLLVGLSPAEVLLIKEIVAHFDLQPEMREISFQQATAPGIEFENVLLTILRAAPERKRTDQDIRRIRRSLVRSAPILVLIDPDQAGRVREFLRAGANEYWILPLDQIVFPPRLYVMMEWGRSSITDECVRIERTGGPSHGVLSVALAVARTARRLFPPWRSRSASRTEPDIIAGKWERIRRLGFGSYGEVWLVREKCGENKAVVKIPHDQRMNTKFIREAAILKRLAGHSNAVELLDVVKEGGKVAIIQEYVEGETLQQCLDRGMEGIGKEKAFLQLLDVVAYAHEMRIMHRDIKPDNIIISNTGILKLLDMGTGKDLTRRSISNTVIGSRPYMAPEQIMGKSRLASDVWALGVILYALATGFLPFYDDNEKQLMDLILESPPEEPGNLEPDLPEELERVILKCLEKDWNNRYRDAGELRRDLLEHMPRFGKGGILKS
jgi:predicted Ser/Thr protein kinase